jgi:hypothetical protein
LPIELSNSAGTVRSQRRILWRRGLGMFHQQAKTEHRADALFFDFGVPKALLATLIPNSV